MQLASEIRISHSLLVVIPLFVLIAELVLGTDFYFAVMMSLTYLFALFAANQAGGLLSISGLCIMSLFVRSIGLSQLVKIILGQPAESNLQMPLETGLLFLLGFGCIFLATSMVKFFPMPIRLVEPITDPKKLIRVSQACLIIVTVAVTSRSMVSGDSGLIRMLNGISVYLQCCAALSVAGFAAARIIETDGQKIISRWGVAALLLSVLQGAVGASKQGMLEPFLAIFLSAVAFNYKSIRKLVFMGIGVGVLTVLVVYPVSQIRKSAAGMSFGKSIVSFADFAMERFSSVEGVLSLLDTADKVAISAAEYEVYYFGRPLSIIDRFSIIGPADRLVAATEKKGLDGYAIVFESVDILPRSVTGNKVEYMDANFIGHKMGILNPFDKTTGISVSPLAHAYSMDSFRGVIILTTVLFFALFLTNNLLGNQLAGNIWSVGTILGLHHLVAEASIGTLYFYILRMFVFYLGLYWVLGLIAEHFDRFFFLQKDDKKTEVART